MTTILDVLEARVAQAMSAATGQTDCVAIVKPATDPRFGDYQANGVMALAKQLKTNPRKLAEQILPQLNLSDICEPPEIAGPGFINLRLKPACVASGLLRINADSSGRLGIEPASKQEKVVVDFSAPNIAKEMHVGHLRSTIIGDAICRLLEFEGHTAIRQNHVGDWGTQFGMLIAYTYRNATVTQREDFASIITVMDLTDIEGWYREAKKLFDTDPQFVRESHEWVVRLQSGNETAVEDWKLICDVSIAACQAMYDQLGVQLTRNDIRGESAYNDDLPKVVEDLKHKGLAKESDGAMCVFPAGFQTKEGEPLPFIVQKSDGAYLYATTDLAAIRYRVNELKADRVVYVTDSRQAQHFQMLFAVADMAGWDKRDGEKVGLVHVMFGSVLGENGKPLKTRSGENVKLKELLDEAVQRAQNVVDEKNPELSEEERKKIAKAVGIGAVKYADYCNNRTSDYVFSFDKMLAMDGNTAPYMQYAYARIRSIERKAKDKGVDISAELSGIQAIDLTEPDELNLGKQLIRYAEAVESAAADYRPNYLTAYLYELAQKFSVFYTNCPVLDASPQKRPTRLLLCDLTARTMRHGLQELLGISVVEQM
jgi:arginyl-tRNA synthetase